MIEDSIPAHEFNNKVDEKSDLTRSMGDVILRQVEISHRGQVDIVANRDSDLFTKWGEKLREIFYEGVPSEWSPTGRPNIMIGDVDGKRFLVKLKERRLEKGDAQMTEDEWAKEFAAPRNLVYAEESVLNEMKLSPQIKAALSTNEVQTKVQELGFNSISFIEPIIGGVSRSPNPDLPYAKNLKEIGWHSPDTDKFMVYEFIEGVEPEEQTGIALKTIVAEALSKTHIEAENGGDLRGDHFLVDDDGNIHLLDAERFTHTPIS